MSPVGIYPRPHNKGKTTLRERFFLRIAPEPNTGCWLWTGNFDKNGYGVVGAGPRTAHRRLKAHRVSWEIHHGHPIPEGMVIDHICRVRCCVNPDHLRILTREQNCRRPIGGSEEMAITEETQIAIASRLAELEAELPVLYAAHRRIQTYLAAPERLKLDTPEEVLTAIRMASKEATDAVDGVTLAESRRGMSEHDADVMAQLNAYGFTALSDKGKLQALAAQKRIERDKAKTLREHGTTVLRLVHEEHKAKGIDAFAEFPHALTEDDL